MQMSEAARRRKTWGNKPCKHPNTDKEYDLGAQTGDYVCTACGRVVEPQVQKTKSPPKKQKKQLS